MIPLAFVTQSADRFVAIAIVIFFAIGIHEYCHAKFADMAGDPTPSFYGRVTLNLFKHFDPIGTIMIVLSSLAGFGIGWGKPVPMDPRKMNNPKWDHFTAVAAGPVSNIVQAVIFAGLLRLLGMTGAGALNVDSFLVLLCLAGVMVNISLFLFNLIPLGPLDGMWLLGTFLDDRTRVAWTRWNLTVGQFVFLGVILFSQLSPGGGIFRVLQPMAESLQKILLG